MLFSGASDLLSQIVKPLVNSSTDFSPLVNSFQRLSFLCTSSWLSSTLFWSLSSPLNSFQLVLAHLTSVPPAQFFLSPVKVTQLQTFLLRPFHSIMLSTFDCVIILLPCTIIQSYWTVDCYLWVERSNMLGPQHFFHVREDLWCHEQPFVKSAREQHSRTRLWVLLPERRNEQGHASSTAARATGMQRGVANAGSTAVRSSSLLFLLDWVAKHKRITHNGNTNWNSKTGSRSPRTKNDLASTFWKKFL